MRIAKGMPGVLGVWTAADLAAANFNPFVCGLPLKSRDGSPLLQTNRMPLVTDKVRYVGDAVAFVVAETVAQARDAAEAVQVDIEPLPAVTNAAEATRPGAPQLYEHIPNNIALDFHYGDTAKIDAAFTNYCLKGSQTDFTDAQGVKTRLGNSVTEAGFVDSASCISCHGTAAFSFVTGGWSMNRIFSYNSTPIGVTGPLDAGQFWLYPDKDPMRPQDAAIFKSSDFVWSIPLCAVNDATGKSNCSTK